MDELRAIIYRERTDLDAFLEEHKLWEDLYDEYYVEMHAKSLQNNAWCGPFALHDFNRAYYYCHLVLLDPHPENNFNRKFIVHENCSKPIHARSTLIAYIILSLSNHRNERSVKRFLKAAGPLLEAYEGFQSAKSFVRDNKDKYDFSIKITPTSAEELEKNYGEGLTEFWYRLLDSIDDPGDQQTIRRNPPGKYYTVLTIEKIISLYKSKKQKLKIIEQMSKAAFSEIWGLNFDITLIKLQAEVEKMPDAEEACAPAEPAKRSASQKPKEGRAKDYLFKKNQTEALAKEFLQELRNKGFEDFNGRKSPAPKKRCEIYRALMKFIRNHNGSVEVKSGASICRFLTASCGILLPRGGNNNSNYETEIRKILNE